MIKSYDFEFGFCIPSSTNSWEAIYDVPERPAETIQDMIDSPNEHTSDTFYFVDNKMVMHNKAYFAYI